MTVINFLCPVTLSYMHFGTASHCIHLFNMYVNFKSFIDDKLMKNITFVNVCNCIFDFKNKIYIYKIDNSLPIH